MRVSVVIPVYNVERYIEQCLTSVYNQTYSDIEVIVVDDCGPDNSIAIAKEVSAKFENRFKTIFLSHEKNRGLSAARNTGTMTASGDYVYYLDSDDQITESCIENLVALADKYPETDIIQGNVCRDENGQKVFGDFSDLDYPEYSCDKGWILKTVLSNDFPITAWNKLISRKFIIDNQLSFKEGIIHEDNYWSWLASVHINSIAFCHIPSYNYRVDNNDSIMNVKYKDRSFISALMMLEEVYLSPPPSFVYRPEIVSRVVKRVVAERLSDMVLSDVRTYNRRLKEVMWKLIKSNNVSFRNKLGFGYLLLPTCLIKGVVMRALFDFWKY